MGADHKPLPGHSQNLKVLQATIEMASAATGRISGYYVLGNVSSVSPMQWHKDMLDSLMYFASENQPIMIMSCPMAGMTSHIFDVQMGIGSTSNIYMNLMCNVDMGFQFFGILDNFNSISYEKWIADEEIINRYQILDQPMNDVSLEYADMIGELGEDAMYAADEDTAEYYREYMRSMDVSTHMDYESWEKEKIGCRQKAEQICERRIDFPVEMNV